MLKIRLSRHGRKNLPFYRIVLTEHTKPSKSGYKSVLWRYNPLSHTMEANVEEIKNWLSKWVKLSERVAKLLFAETKDKMFKDCFVERKSTKWLEIQAKKQDELKEKKKAESEAKKQAEESSKVEEEKEENKEEVKEE